jgi:6-phosphogluconate dehydrogenase (decarboxylating)
MTFGNIRKVKTADFQDKLLSAMRYGFGGHLEKSEKQGRHNDLV